MATNESREKQKADLDILHLFHTFTHHHYQRVSATMVSWYAESIRLLIINPMLLVQRSIGELPSNETKSRAVEMIKNSF